MKRTVFNILVVVLLTVSMVGGAWADDDGNVKDRLDKLEATVAALQMQVSALETTVNALQSQLNTEVGLRANADSDLQNQIDSLVDEIGILSDFSQYVSVETEELNGVTGPHVIFTGANIHIRSGGGSTWDGGNLTGLGNIIIGYNEIPDNLLDGEREGSHNIVIGPRHRFSSYGGLVAGDNNTVNGAYSTISGGYANKASGIHSSISGGKHCKTSGDKSSVSGGYGNQATASFSSISGGFRNQANGMLSSVSGGCHNHANGEQSSISGGAGNLADGFSSSVSGGSENRANGEKSSVSGGFRHFIDDTYNWAAGDYFSAD
jgi:hypothetical protein